MSSEAVGFQRTLAASPHRVQTMRWTGTQLELIDQRAIPVRLEYVVCSSAAETASAIRDMVVRGAPAIGCAAAFGVATEALAAAQGDADRFHDRVSRALDLLAASRPTAVNLFWAIERMRRRLSDAPGSPPMRMAAELAREAEEIYAEDIAANLEMGRAGARLLFDGARVMTHCNAGALATAGHGTALGVIRSARDQGKRISVIANETRPFLQGARLTVWEMMQEDIPVTLITDNMAGHVMSRGHVDAVIVGADRIAANGDTANKIGTYTLAVLAGRHRIPFYVAAPLSTIDLGIVEGAQIPIEERDGGEVTGFGGLRWAPEGVAVANPAFDVTPAGLVTALITERGVIAHPDARQLRALFEA